MASEITVNNWKWCRGILRGVLLLTLTLSPVISSVAQQFPFELWHDGKVVAVDGDTLKGLIKYDMQQDVVQLTTDGKTVSFLSARKLLSFEIFDNTVHRYRRFFALPFTTGGSYEALRLFELLSEGRLTLLCREAVENRSVPIGTYGSAWMSRQVLVYTYFLIDGNGKITEFTGRKNDLLQMMGRHSDAVDKFIKANHLSLEHKQHFADIVDYYNSIRS